MNNTSLKVSLRGTNSVQLTTMKRIERSNENEYFMIFRYDRLTHYITYDIETKQIKNGHTSGAWNLIDIDDQELSRITEIVKEIAEREELMHKLSN